MTATFKKLALGLTSLLGAGFLIVTGAGNADQNAVIIYTDITGDEGRDTFGPMTPIECKLRMRTYEQNIVTDGGIVVTSGCVKIPTQSQ